MFCPYCYNDPPFGDSKKGMGCNECLHPSCPQSLTKKKIADCQECDQGVLTVDPNSMPKWKILCTKSVGLFLFSPTTAVNCNMFWIKMHDHGEHI